MKIILIWLIKIKKILNMSGLFQIIASSDAPCKCNVGFSNIETCNVCGIPKNGGYFYRS